MKSLRILFVFILSMATTSVAFAQYNSLHFYEPDRWDFYFGVDYQNSTQNYTSEGGSFEALQKNHYFQTINFDLGTRGILAENIGLSTNLKFSMVESEDYNDVRTNNGMNEIKVAADWLMYEGYFEFIPEAYIIYPFFKVDTATDDALLGEGAMEIGAKLWLQKSFKYFHTYGMFGAAYRDDGRAAIMPYAVGAEWDNRLIDIGGEIAGNFRLTNDDNTDVPVVRNAVTARVNAGSYKYYAVNSTLMDAKIWLNYDANESFSIKGGIVQTLNGESAAAGFTLFALVNYGLGNNPPPTKIKETEEELKPIQAEAVTQPTFTPELTEEEKQQEAFQAPQSKSESEIEQEIKDTEMKIKLKKKKKKTAK